MSHSLKKQQGLSLIAAIFLIVVLSSLAVFLTRLTAMQSINVIHTMVSVQADYTSRAGMQWAAAKALKGECDSANGASLTIDAFTVAIECRLFSNGLGGVRENGRYTLEGVDHLIYEVSSTAVTSGKQPGDPDYIRRRYGTQVVRPAP